MRFARSPLLVGVREKKTYRGQRSTFPSQTSRFAPLIIAHRGSAFPWLVDDRAFLRPRQIWCVPNRESATRLSATMPPASHAPLPPEGHQLKLERSAHLGSTLLSQPYRRHVSTDRLKRENNQLAASLEGEPGPTTTGKTLPHSYPEPRFRGERARGL